jgi:hypothetical protein
MFIISYLNGRLRGLGPSLRAHFVSIVKKPTLIVIPTPSFFRFLLFQIGRGPLLSGVQNRLRAFGHNLFYRGRLDPQQFSSYY